MPKNLWIPIAVSFVAVVIISPIVGWFIKPHIDVRNNKILQKKKSYIELLALVKLVIGNLNYVHKEASKDTKKLLIPTARYALTTRLSKVEDDIRDIIRLMTLLEVYDKKHKLNYDYTYKLADVVGGALRIKENIETNTDKTINGKIGLREVNKVNLKNKYIKTLTDLLKDLEAK